VGLLFKPVGVLAGLGGGLIAKKIFAAVWSAVDDQEPPQAEHRRVGLGRLTMALAIEGALFSVARGLVDHGARSMFALLTGSWPGDEAPETNDEEGGSNG
jgi:hypothetical protein